MASSSAPSTTEVELKRRGRRRLIGAIALGLVAIVVLPMVFDTEPKRANKSGQEISIQIPPKDGLPALPAPVISSSKDAPETKVGKIAPPPVTVVLPDKPVSESPPTAKAAVTSTAAPVETASAAPAAVPVKAGFVIQVGAFRDADNVKQLVDQMKAAKLPVFTDSIAVVSGKVTRVRVGPYADRSRADAALAQVKLAGADGKVVAFP